MKAAFYTLGCRLNQFETDSLITQFNEAGFEIVNFKETADIYVINTCTVTKRSDYKSRNAVNRAVRKNKNAIIIVTGCYADTNYSDVDIEGVDLIIDNKKKHGILKFVKNILDDKKNLNINDDEFNYPAPVKGIHTRSYLKIQDGCDCYCAYCKVPFARGVPKSRDLNDVVSAFNQLINAGVKEIVLTGVNIGKYDPGVSTLVKELIKIDKDFRIHLSSIELNFINEKLLNLFYNEKVCAHLHIPLQSGSDYILNKMNRNYTSNDFITCVDNIRQKFPLINLTTDVIIGFPGEKDEDFEKTLNIIDYCDFSHIHTFKYSQREGTKAYNMKEQIPSSVKKQRSELIRNKSFQLNKKYNEKFINEKLRVLVEKNKIIDNENASIGKTDEYIEIIVNDNLKIGCFYNVKLVEIKNNVCYGIIV